VAAVYLSRWDSRLVDGTALLSSAWCTDCWHHQHRRQ